MFLLFQKNMSIFMNYFTVKAFLFCSHLCWTMKYLIQFTNKPFQTNIAKYAYMTWFFCSFCLSNMNLYSTCLIFFVLIFYFMVSRKRKKNTKSHDKGLWNQFDINFCRNFQKSDFLHEKRHIPWEKEEIAVSYGEF